MPLPISINSLIEQRTVESSRIDYKAGWNPEAIIHSICAFANDIHNLGGGYIIIGIEDENGMPKHPVKGVDKASIDKINKDLINKCNLIEPRYIPVVSHEVYEGKDLIVIWASGGSVRPYKCPVEIYSEGAKKQKSEKAYYIRKASSTIKADINEEMELHVLSNRVPFDDQRNRQASIADIDYHLVAGYLTKVKSSLASSATRERLSLTAEAMGLMDGPKESRGPKNVALLFFNENPEAFFPYSRIEFVHRPEPTGENMMESIFTGPLDRQLTQALGFLKNYAIMEKIIKVPDEAEAIRFFNFPYRAIEEALVNAVYHKSYEIREPITVTLTPTYLDILSFPGPERTINDEDLRAGIFFGQHCRNRRIGDYLKELDLAEGRNTGIALMQQAMKNNGSPAPIFSTNEDRTYFNVRFPIHEGFLPEEKGSSPTAGRRSAAELQEAILKTLADYGRLSVAELSAHLGYTMPPSSLRKAIKILIDENRIMYTEKGHKSPNQKLKLNIH